MKIEKHWKILSCLILKRNGGTDEATGTPLPKGKERSLAPRHFKMQQVSSTGILGLWLQVPGPKLIQHGSGLCTSTIACELDLSCSLLSPQKYDSLFLVSFLVSELIYSLLIPTHHIYKRPGSAYEVQQVHIVCLSKCSCYDMYGYFHVYIYCVPCVPGIYRGQKRTSYPLEPELQNILRCHMELNPGPL